MHDFKESSSTDKLAVIGTIIDKLLDKLPPDKIMEITTLEIKWDESDNGEVVYPILSMDF